MSNPTALPNKPLYSLETRLQGTFATRFVLELFGNTLHFPIANVLFELLVEGVAYLRYPDLYILLSTALLQAYFLTRWQDTPRPRRLWGNLIAPFTYTVLEVLFEGLEFFAAPNHLAYWGFALVLGILQAVAPRLPSRLAALALLLESIVRTSILFFMYGLFETHANPGQTISVTAFFTDSAHQFIALVVLFLGVSAGLANLVAQRYFRLLQQTSTQLKTYSEWLLGRDLLERIMANPNALTLSRQTRTLLFMDIRSFTAWSDAHSAEEVATLLARYYRVAESVLVNSSLIKYKFAADEVLVVFATVESGVATALRLRTQVNQLLAEQKLGAGIGLNTGEVVEGLLGSSQVKFYDVVGDAVNVAKRIESQAVSGEILAADRVRLGLSSAVRFGVKREITVKGKTGPLTVYPLSDQTWPPVDG
jgi:adenylate cyclase